MKKLLLKVIFGIGILLVCMSTAFAGSAWSQPVNVLEVWVEAPDRGYIIVDANSNTTGCDGGPTVRFSPNSDYGKQLLSLALAAKLSGKKVIYYYTGCDDWNRHVLSGLWIK
jgi:hypothetical protein